MLYTTWIKVYKQVVGSNVIVLHIHHYYCAFVRLDTNSSLHHAQFKASKWWASMWQLRTEWASGAGPVGSLLLGVFGGGTLHSTMLYCTYTIRYV